jgi:hypothetical protein
MLMKKLEMEEGGVSTHDEGSHHSSNMFYREMEKVKFPYFLGSMDG